MKVLLNKKVVGPSISKNENENNKSTFTEENNRSTNYLLFIKNIKTKTIIYRPSARSTTLTGQKRLLQGCLKQLNLEKGPRYNTRSQDNMLQNQRFFYHKSLKTHCTFSIFQQL